jgi:hypothetical protein
MRIPYAYDAICGHGVAGFAIAEQRKKMIPGTNAGDHFL